MNTNLPIIKEYTLKKRNIHYLDSDMYDPDEILDVIFSRKRFSQVREMIEKLERIPDDKFSNMFKNHFLIQYDSLNDARIALLGLCYTIRKKAKYCVGNYIVTSSSLDYAMNSGFGFGSPFDDDEEDFADNSDEILDALLDESNPLIIQNDFGMYDDEITKYRDRNVSFTLRPSMSPFGFGEDTEIDFADLAKSKRLVFIKLEKDSVSDLCELFQEIIHSAGLSTQKVKKQLKSLLDIDDRPTEYSINSLAQIIINNHLLKAPDSDFLTIEDIEGAVNYEKPKMAKASSANKLIGLEDEQKKLNGIISMLRFERRRANLGYKSITNGCNMVFAGPPGTAKTTLARMFAKALHKEGLIQSADNFFECKKSDLVGAYVGWTAAKVDEMFSKMNDNGGGVIFFDEIYTLSDSNTAFDQEAITCITQNMENYREKVYCVFAGYANKMEEFLSSNPGLRSRIHFTIKFYDYEIKTLCNIFKSIAKASDFKIEKGCNSVLENHFAKLKASRRDQFGNGREARNLFTNAIQKTAQRLFELDNIDDKLLTVISKEDLTLASSDILDSELSKKDTRSIRKIGF